MKKSLMASFAAFVFALTVFPVFAGDAAVFQEIGFSEDEKTFIFGQYGMTDMDFEPWAEIYVVDVEKNDYVAGEVYKTSKIKVHADSGKKAYQELSDKCEWKLAKYKAKPSSVENLVYVRDKESKLPTDEIVFKDYENSSAEKSEYYHFKLIPSFSGKGENVLSSYYIDLQKKDGEGNVIYKKIVGNPDIKRKGVSSYKIVRCFSGKSGQNLVFIIEKTFEDKSGTSIRYMVETVKL